MSVADVAMIPFIDPRSDPEPPAQVAREPAAHGEELTDLTRLCSTGRVYAVEQWIQEGRPLQALTYRRPGKPAVVSPLSAAIRQGSPDIVLLLLCNGYRLDLEGAECGSVLDLALSYRAFEIMEILLKWGADPARTSGQAVIETYKTDLIDRFWKLGVDYTRGPSFFDYLAHTSNKPLYGWLKHNKEDRRLQDALDVALLEAVIEERERPAHLLVWAGADPHRKVPMLRDLGSPDAWDPNNLFSSAAEAAIIFGRHQLLDLLRINKMPNVGELAAHAHDSYTLKKLIEIRPPEDWSGVIVAFLRPFYIRLLGGSWDARDALKLIESNSGRLTTISPDELRYLRRGLLEVPDDDFTWVLRWLKNEKHCEVAIYAELTRTGAMRQKIGALASGSRYLTPSVKMSRANQRRRRTAERVRARSASPQHD